jgi:hypothetical protein
MVGRLPPQLGHSPGRVGHHRLGDVAALHHQPRPDERARHHQDARPGQVEPVVAVVWLVDPEPVALHGELGMQVGQHGGQASVGEPLHAVGQVQSADRPQPWPHRQHRGLPVAPQGVGDGGQVGGRVLIERPQQQRRQAPAVPDPVELDPHQLGRAGDHGLQLLGEPRSGPGRGGEQEPGQVAARRGEGGQQLQRQPAQPRPDRGQPAVVHGPAAGILEDVQTGHQLTDGRVGEPHPRQVGVGQHELDHGPS